MSKLDISIVLYRNSPSQIEAVLDSIVRQEINRERIHRVLLLNNCPEESAELDRLLASINSSRGLPLELRHAEANIGFGRAQNRNFSYANADYFLVLNPDCILESDALSVVLENAANDPEAAAWEMRQLPYEHPKFYDPVTCSTDWVACAAVLFRREAFAEIGGFDERIFLYAEDVDISWRLRANGWLLRYVPRASTLHNSYQDISIPKPIQAIEGIYGSLALRARYGRKRDIAAGLFYTAIELLAPARFARRRQLVFGAVARFIRNATYFRKSGRAIRSKKFRPYFFRWNYAKHRYGANYPCARFKQSAPPLVSVLIRTHQRPWALRAAIVSALNQTYENIEIVVVEDGAPRSFSVVADQFGRDPRVRYFATDICVGRSAAGNQAMQLARGDWFVFLDDDDLLFADHVETLLYALQGRPNLLAYGFAWEVPSELVIDQGGAPSFQDQMPILRFRTKYSRKKLWEGNFLPIQSVLFHRSLFDRLGGFNESVDLLEDWLLWATYSLGTDFLMVPKVTSMYRVPADSMRRIARQRAMDDAKSKIFIEMHKLEARLCLKNAGADGPVTKSLTGRISRHGSRAPRLNPLLGIFRFVKYHWTAGRSRFMNW